MLLQGDNISKHASSAGHDNSRGHALHVVRDEGRVAAVAAVASGVPAVLLVTGTAGIELEHALRLAAKGAKCSSNGVLIPYA